jgi:hypothetical protein
MKKWMTPVVGTIVACTMTGCATLQARAVDRRQLNNVRKVAIACHAFADQHGGVMPSSTADLAPYVGKECDLSQVDLVAVGKLPEIKDPASVVLIRSKRVSSTGKRAVAFVDAHCELLSEK